MTAPPHQFLDTRAWDADAARHLDDLALCPTIFQERIFGPADVRVTVVGRELFAACIETARGRAGIDSRLDPDAPCAAYELPRNVQRAILRLMDELGLVIGTVDLKLANDGEHVFLEINPQGQFLYIEILSGLPISNALAEFLACD
jgi:glutathione synthase/RimK-type ligase-like ATP-grasp enzyme